MLTIDECCDFPEKGPTNSEICIICGNKATKKVPILKGTAEVSIAQSGRFTDGAITGIGIVSRKFRYEILYLTISMRFDSLYKTIFGVCEKCSSEANNISITFLKKCISISILIVLFVISVIVLLASNSGFGLGEIIPIINWINGILLIVGMTILIMSSKALVSIVKAQKRGIIYKLPPERIGKDPFNIIIFDHLFDWMKNRSDYTYEIEIPEAIMSEVGRYYATDYWEIDLSLDKFQKYYEGELKNHNFSKIKYRLVK